MGQAPRQPYGTYLLLNLDTGKKCTDSDVFIDDYFSLVTRHPLTGEWSWHMDHFDSDDKLSGFIERTQAHNLHVDETSIKYYTDPGVKPSVRAKIM